MQLGRRCQLSGSFMSATMTALQKDGGVRGIKQVQSVCSPFQFALSTRAAQILRQSCHQVVTEVLSIDGSEHTTTCFAAP